MMSWKLSDQISWERVKLGLGKALFHPGRVRQRQSGWGPKHLSFRPPYQSSRVRTYLIDLSLASG